ncbi:YceI family protein [uncultured Planktosalinus sp.]|uniref:YceI family protein n=1 Tax=uncultured Planktosalinus sp. TaxID=1810935 RepID=UPI0030DA2069
MKTLKSIAIIFLTVFVTQQINAQVAKVNSANSIMTVFGTSNIHDWDMKAEKMSGDASFKIENGKLAAIDKLTYAVEVESLKSGKSGMDKNAYNALDTKKHKTINYNLTKVTKISDTGSNSYSIETIGNLTIAGQTKQVPITFNVQLNGSKLTFSGKVKINMTHYNVEPPKALMGTVKTGEDLTLDFKVLYN